MAFDQNKYINQFKKENYEEYRVLVPKGKKAIIKSRADELGITMSQLTIRALEKTYLLDLTKEESKQD